MARTAVDEARFRDALAAIDAGDIAALERSLEADPELARDRLPGGEGYFRDPYLLWFVAENPVRTGRLPANIGEVARTILRAAGSAARDQAEYALGLAASGRVPRESGVQRELIDVLVDAGADPNTAMNAAAAHGEGDAVRHLMARGARLTLQAAVCVERDSDIDRIWSHSSPDDRRAALIVAALGGRAPTVRQLIALGAEVNGYGPPGFHAHATPLHDATSSGSLDTVTALVEAGADTTVRDRVYDGTPLEWAEHLRHGEIAAFLRARGADGD